jgi:hypothetical protein
MWVMWPLFHTVVDLREEADVLRRRPYGVIEMVNQRLAGIHLRPWPRVVSAAEVRWLGARFHQHRPGNRCLLYYNQPIGFRNFLTLKYVVSSRGATLRTFRGALVILDEIARLKQSDAALCEASNLRISDRLLNRWGWRRHVPDSDRRHFIKRFYGQYPPPDQAWALSQHAPHTDATDSSAAGRWAEYEKPETSHPVRTTPDTSQELAMAHPDGAPGAAR